MSQPGTKRKREIIDDGPQPKKIKVSEPRLPILSALDDKNKTAIIAAYNSGNDTLFEMSCGTFDIDPSATKLELIEHSKIKLENTYRNLNFSVKKKLKYLCVQYQSDAISQSSFKQEASKLLRADITPNNVLYVIELISDDTTGLYPTVSCYQRRHETKKPKNLHPLLHSIWPTKITSKFETKMRAILQLQHEIDTKMKHFKTIVANEYEFRLDIYDRMNAFAKQMKSIQIRAKKVLTLDEAVTAMNEFKAKPNWKRDMDLRCDDMITMEALLSSTERDVRLNIEKIKNRMIYTLNIAYYDENDEAVPIKMKTTQRGFGTYKPTATFMEYSIMLNTMKQTDDEIRGLIDELSTLDVSQFIGNESKERRAKKAAKRRERNAESVQKNRAKKKEKEKENDSTTIDVAQENVTPGNSRIVTHEDIRIVMEILNDWFRLNRIGQMNKDIVFQKIQEKDDMNEEHMENILQHLHDRNKVFYIDPLVHQI
eukprot:193849_1